MLADVVGPGYRTLESGFECDSSFERLGDQLGDELVARRGRRQVVTSPLVRILELDVDRDGRPGRREGGLREDHAGDTPGPEGNCVGDALGETDQALGQEGTVNPEYPNVDCVEAGQSCSLSPAMAWRKNRDAVLEVGDELNLARLTR